MSMPLAAGERLRNAVLCVRAADQPGSVSGTGFAISPGVILTTAHVVLGKDLERLVVTDQATIQAPVNGITFAPNEASQDLAMLEADVPEALILPCASATHGGDPLVARGYSPTAAGRGGRELRFTPRGKRVASYQKYRIEDAFELAGDMAEGGFSGSPMMDIGSGTVIGVISGGDPARNVSWALPLSGAGANWPALGQALAWNDSHVARFGHLVNTPGARIACERADAAALKRMHAIGKFNLQRHVNRRGLLATIRKFRHGGRPMIAIVGGSNTGKTWVMCDLARRLEYAPSLLITASDLPRQDAPSLPEFAASALRAAWPIDFDLPNVPDLPPLVAALAKAGSPLLILLDGINEALDVRNFLRTWLPEAVAWVREHRTLLCVSTRPEPWAALVRAIPDARQVLYNPAPTAQKRTEDEGLPEQRVARLGDFSTAEVAEALRAYKLDGALNHAIGSHPLMFRIGADLGRTSLARNIGRYRLIDAFVDRYLDEAISRLGRVSSATLRIQLQKMAASLSTDGSGTLDLETASASIGDDEVMNALIACGLLVEAGAVGGTRAERVRFTFDEVGEALAPGPQDPTHLFSLDAVRDALALRRDAAGLLRLEADGNDPAFRIGLERLLALLEAFADANISGVDPEAAGAAAVYVAQALPAGRSDAIEAIGTGLVGTAPTMARRPLGFRGLVDWLTEVPVRPDRRAALLLEIAPWGVSWPYRDKDWSDPDRRKSFEQAVEGDGYESRYQVGAALNVLLKDHPEVRPILLHALADRRLIDQRPSDNERGEASISSLAAGLLFHRRQDDLEGLVDALLVRRGDAAGQILSAIAESDPAMLFDLALTRLGDPSQNQAAIWMIGQTASRIDPAGHTAAAAGLEPLICDPGEVGQEAAVLLLRLKPGHLPAWDRIAYAFVAGTVTGYALNPVPSLRFERALELAMTRPVEGLQWMRVQNGSVRDQARMAEAASRLFAEGTVGGRDIGWLIEDNLRKFARAENNHLRPWVTVAKDIARSNDVEARRHLIVAVFSDARFSARLELAEVAEMLADGARNAGEVWHITWRLVESAYSPLVTWIPLFDRVRQRDAKTADSAAFDQLVSGLTEKVRRICNELLRHWDTLPTSLQSSFSTKVLELWKKGTSIQKLLTSDTLAKDALYTLATRDED